MAWDLTHKLENVPKQKGIEVKYLTAGQHIIFRQTISGWSIDNFWLYLSLSSKCAKIKALRTDFYIEGYLQLGIIK